MRSDPGENHKTFRLTSGKGDSPNTACLMQRAALIHAERHGYLDRMPTKAILTDHPCWANECLTIIAIACNDNSSDEDRQRLKPLLDRIVMATRKSPNVEKRINARILCHQAHKVLHLVPDECRDACERSIATREAWLRGEVTEEECAEAARVAEAARAARAARVAEAAWAAWAAWAAGAAWVAGVAGVAGAEQPDWFDWLDEALDIWEKACAEEGVLSDDSESERLVHEFIQAGGS